MYIKVGRCSRCGNEGETIIISAVRPGGHSLPSLSQPDFERATPPLIEHVCGACITDWEMTMMLTPVVEYVISGLIRDAAKEKPSSHRDSRLVSLETVRAYFTVLNYQKDNRPAALAALGFGRK